MVSNSLYRYVAGWAKRSPATVLLHFALVIVLAGALTTFFWGRHGQITVFIGREVSMVDGDDEDFQLPFAFELLHTDVDYYPASTAPRGYSCLVRVVPGGNAASYETTIAMDKVLKVDSFRFTLVSIGAESATFTVNHDPVGILITYLGYGLLFIAMAAFFFQPRKGFVSLLRRLSHSRVSAVLMLLLSAQGAGALTAVRDVVPDNVARTFGKIYVYWDDRPVPMQTMTRAILQQVYGSGSYQGLSADQVALGWLVSYDQWKREPIIKVKSERIRKAIGIDSKYARLVDFFDVDGYKLQPLLDGHAGEADLANVDRSVQLLTSLAVGKIMRIYPYMSANGRMEWLSWTDYKPSRMPLDQWEVVANSMGAVVRDIILDKNDAARHELLQIRKYQLETTAAAGVSLSEGRFRAEVWYNKMASPLWVAIAVLVVSVAIAFCLLTHRCRKIARNAAFLTLAASGLWLVTLISLRWYIAGHSPLTNGPESMEVMALLALIVGGCCIRRLFIVTLTSLVVAALALAVAAMSGNASVISPLMPVLNNPLLSIHVFVIMFAYALLTIVMLLSVCVLLGGYRMGSDMSHRVSLMSLTMLYPAVFLLCAGIFIGAIWANQSWGRYWGWDPKETWALVTMIVYSLPLHWKTIKWLRNERCLAAYLTAAYLSVIITYFGVNFLFGGLHSYM